jgi:hypothetical protein
MLIIQIEALESGQHPIQSQSGRKTCWLPGYIEVPHHLEREVWACLGWCDLTIEGGKLNGITPGAIPEPEPAPEPEPTAQEDNDAMLVDHEYRLTLVELGVTSDAV